MAEQANHDRLRRNIESTMANLVHTNNLIATSGDAKMKRALSAKNEQRQQALDQMMRQAGEFPSAPPH